MDNLQARHSKELHDLESRIFQKKRAATKKTRKGVDNECDALRQRVEERQAAELDAITGDDETSKLEVTTKDELADQVQSLGLQERDTSVPEAHQQNIQNFESPSNPAPRIRKPNRARARIERRKAEQEALVHSASQEASDLPDLNRAEREKMIAQFKARGLVEQEIRADGHCLYSAFADQMSISGMSLALQDTTKKPFPTSSESQGVKDTELFKTVRASAADYIAAHPDDFAPFLDEPLPAYVNKIRDTAEWGGQLELMALAKTYGVEINVLQGDGRVEAIAPDDVLVKAPKFWLAYYRHGFVLGEHYNSLRPRPPGADEET